MQKQNKYFFVAIGFAMLTVALISMNYTLMINATGSLGNFAFLVRKGVYPTKTGEYAAFTPPPNPYYDKNFVKIVGGIGGDIVTEKERVFYVNGNKIGLAKELSLKGDKLDPGPTGTLPTDTYFMYSPHKDSYDSRYKQMGWISKNRVIGVAIPVL